MSVSTDGYQYPDVADEIISLFIQQAEPYEGYWAVSEQRALDLIGQRLEVQFGDRSATTALDAGCGPGRLLPWIARFADRITAVDGLIVPIRR